ncbi:MAG: beta-1,3-galactosyltransferase [uncultured bacterium]|uniref:Glycosyltransferase 2-like domain-containing protein n=3 Tax=Candidatus Daviesiibacteriota TaxID=1752718 RepID=A0A1F5IND8_9BACT|nr:MAG: beta-1,3-galactosyltransferase [uncultured bacterium]KKQ10584.1 MAG: putative beta-1,3-galactosyltransferase [Candidatus Daviesbacteria bacterium GW2011_GWB1_36_5]KKQ15713.1 MAG: putative beta-1,3-galactosyltransferase [Candidatus Daviesbacteria bacterium GW2011_GWA1_36_8]OGE17868.1 MAG: hypothetical protein A2858_03935 [Candidatus Daviesbacteria bacterium RIFCSPHIGHO2_01_FULL_36_37]
MKKASKLPLVSVIIPTRNSIRTIEEALKSIKSQTYPKIEIIIVDQFSSDNTLNIAKKFTNKIYKIKGDKFYSAPPVSRNLGAKNSKGKYLLHMDSDMQLSKKVVEECVNKLERNSNLLALKIHEEDIGTGFWSRAKMLERKFYVGFDLIEAARFIRRNVFLKLNGYDEQLRSGEDWDLSQRIEKIGKISDIENKIVHNLGKMNYIYQVKKKFNYGLTLNQILKKHNFTPSKDIAMIFRSTYFKNPKLFITDPIGTLGFIILRPSELIAYLIGIFWAKFFKTK